MDIGEFIKRCFELGIMLLGKEKLTKEEEELLHVLDELEKNIEEKIIMKE